jgi:hypothetical protein
MISIQATPPSRRRSPGLILRRLLYRLGHWLIHLSNPQASTETIPSAYHLDPETLATGFTPETRAQLAKAAQDFEAATRGLEPIHATKEVAMLDGGTTLWQGDGYSIRLMKSLTTLGDIHGLMFGPVLTLNFPLAHGNTTEISHVTFYTSVALDKFLGKK